MLPTSRTLLGWWRELADLKPQRLWFSRLRLHRVEALAEIALLRQLDRLQLALLRSLALPAAPSRSRNGAGDREAPGVEPAGLHLDRQVLTRLLGALAREGLVEGGGGRWGLTPAGREALAAGRFVARARERLAFYFVDNTPLQRPPHFLALDRPPTTPLRDVADWHFDAALLTAWVHESPDRKSRYRFPGDVTAILGATPEEAGAADWRRVILDVPEELLTVLVEAAPEGGESPLLGFPVRAEGWILNRERPVLALRAGWAEIFPELIEEPPAESWRRAWRDWCHPRDLLPADVEACRLEHSGHVLRVHAPARLIERLRAARSDAIKHDAWLLAGGGRSHTAARIELFPAE